MLVDIRREALQCCGKLNISGENPGSIPKLLPQRIWAELSLLLGKVSLLRDEQYTNVEKRSAHVLVVLCPAIRRSFKFETQPSRKAILQAQGIMARPSGIYKVFL